MGLSDNLRNIEAEIAAGRPEQALTLCLELQTSYPRALALQRVLGEAYLALRKPREALGALDRALAGNPEDARACCARAIIQQIHGDAASALKWYRRACDITPDDQVLRSAYRELASSQGQPAYRPTRSGLARLYLRGDLLSHAIREWESLLAEEPDSLEAQVGLAETLWRAERIQPAIERCERILINAPACVKAMLILAIIEHDAGHPDVAERLVRRTADLDPDCRIGQLLCADRLSAGDHALRALLMSNDSWAGREPATSGPPASSSTNVPPGIASGARTRGASAPLPEPSVLRNPPVPSQPLAGSNSEAEQQRGTTLPANFRNIFAETEYMLWGKDNDDLGDVSRIPTGGLSNLPNTTTREDQFARSNVYVPPVLRDQGVNLDDTEARTSINFVNWLQAQGALQQDAIPVPPRPPVTRQLPPAPASAASPGTVPSGVPLSEQFSASSSFQSPADQLASITQQQTQQYGEPDAQSSATSSSRDDLRRMFAELGQQAGAYGASDGAVSMDGISSDESAARDRSERGGPVKLGEAHLLIPSQEIEPSSYPERLERARQRRSAGQIDQALNDYRLVLKNAPDLLPDVMGDLNESLEEAPDHPELHRLLGDAYIRQGNYLQALEAYNRAVALTQAQDGP
jgi:tetratricopeptide (TPR) repeat protein